jgi:hypothetical protein
MTMALLTAASWETVIRRSLLMAQGACTPAEYWRMGEEKAAAMRSSVAAIMTGRSRGIGAFCHARAGKCKTAPAEVVN